MDISLINRKAAVITIRENQRQDFLKLEENANPIPLPKWSMKEQIRLSLQYNRAYCKPLRDAVLSDLTKVQKHLILTMALQRVKASSQPLYIIRNKEMTIQYDLRQIKKMEMETIGIELGKMEIDTSDC
jgi:hypothetical protein